MMMTTAATTIRDEFKSCAKRCARGVASAALAAFLVLLLHPGVAGQRAAAQNSPSYDRLERAADLISKGETASAEAELKIVLKQSPREANALNLLGVIRAEQRRADEAEKLFLSAIETNKALVGAYLNLGRLYLDANKSERALWAYTQASKLVPDDPEINFTLAALYEARRDYALALEHLGKIPAEAATADALYLLIKSHLGLGHTSEAQSLAAPLKAPGRVPADLAASFAALFAQSKLLDDAIEILEAARKNANPSFELLYNLGASYYQKGERARAEEAYAGALALAPDNVPTLRALSGLARDAGDMEKALSYLVRARKVAPDSSEVLYDFGWTALNMNLLFDALTALEKLYRQKPDEPNYLYPLAIARLHNGETARAQQLITRYIELRPDDSRGHYVLGAILYSLKKFPEARASLKRSLALSYYADAENNLGLIAHAEGDEREAAARLKSALKANPQNAAAHAALGLVYAKEKDYGAARAELERAVAINPKDQTAHYQLGLVYARLGDKERSQAMFALAEKLRTEEKEREIVGFKLIDPPQ